MNAKEVLAEIQQWSEANHRYDDPYVVASTGEDHVEWLLAYIGELGDQLAAVRAALEPFAAIEVHESFDDEVRLLTGSNTGLTVGHLRRAREALRQRGIAEAHPVG